MSDNYDELMAFATEIAEHAGVVMLDYFYRQDQGVATKDDTTLVTEADQKINDYLIAQVKQRLPQYGVLGEEASWQADKNKLWVCDPIDGTDGFIDGVPTAMFSLAFVANGSVVLGVMYDPYQKRLLSAIKGKGAMLNGGSISVSQKDNIKQAKVFTVSGVSGFLERVELYKDLMAQGAYVKLVPGNVFKSSLIATGKADGYYFPGKKAHDIAAAKLIVEEAGGKVTDLDGNEQPYNGSIRGAIISNGQIHNELVAAVRRYGSEEYLGF